MTAHADRDVSQAASVFDDPEALAHGVAEWMVALAGASSGAFSICLSGGSTPRRLYEVLADAPIARRFPWDRVHWFWGDERFVPHDHPDSNFRMVKAALLSRAPIPGDHVHAIPTQGLSPEAAASAYQATLQRFHGGARLDPDRPLFDVTLLGLGEDGHVASLFPRDAAPAQTSRWVMAVTAENGQQRITLTYPALESSRHLAFVVAGARKREMLARLRSGDRALPAARVRPTGDVHWFADRAAAGGADTTSAPRRTAAIVVMGVSGSGKSTIGALIAGRLHWEFVDGDWFHPPGNVEKMHQGIPLTDEDRRPWLDAIAAWIDETRRSGGHGVVACSALKRRYRDILIGDRPDVRLVYLKGDEALIARRIATRHGHFMPPALLHSQFDALEEPGPDEHPVVASIAPPPREIVAQVVAALEADAAASGLDGSARGG